MKKHIRRASAAALVCLSIPSMAFASTHKVQSGESLWAISQQYHVSVSTIEQTNHLHTTTIHIGQVLQIPSNTSTSTPGGTHATSRAVTKTAVVTVKQGDSIWSISRRYGVSTTSILKLNGLSSSSLLHIGDKVKVEVSAATKLSGRSESAVGGSNLADAVVGQQIVNYAKQFVGVPYQWGGESASGFDCSGYVQFVLGHFGIQVGRSSYSQYQDGSSVSESNLEVGDLVFFSTDGSGASHVGIYIGGGQFINAEDRGVRVDALSSSYWARAYVGGRHVR